MDDLDVTFFVEKLMQGKRPFLSILSYPHPFTPGGVILVVEDDVSDLLGLIGEAHRLLPPGLSLHCLRRRELFQLCLPGLFAPPFVVNERPFLPYWLQHKGRVWWGEDLRHMVEPGAEPRRLLAGHLESCRDSLRRYGILPALLGRKYADLLEMLQQEMLRLMGTAVLLYDQWDIDPTTLPDLFARLFPEAASPPIWPLLTKQRQRLAEPLDKLEGQPAAVAYHAVWLFETFVRHLEVHT